MGFYARFVLPRLIDRAMKNKDTTRLREAWIPQAGGDVLEIGIGSGLNLPFYSADVERLWGVDPSVELQQMARSRSSSTPLKVEFLTQSAEEQIRLPNASIDFVVVTWTLCSIANAPGALQEMKRVLKPSGRLIFVEHGRAPDSRLIGWQDRLTPIWKRFTGGCHLNRKMDDLITDAGFTIIELKTGYQPGPRAMTFTYQGLAASA